MLDSQISRASASPSALDPTATSFGGLPIPPGLTPIMTIAHILTNLGGKEGMDAKPTPECLTPRFFDNHSQFERYRQDMLDSGQKCSPNEYITDENGDFVGADVMDAAYQDAKRIWAWLYSVYLEAPTFGNKDDVFWEYFKARMYALHPYFQFCKNDWKLHHFGVVKYADWSRPTGPIGKCTRMFLLS